MLADLIHQHKEVKHLEAEKNAKGRVPSPQLPFGTSSTAVSFALFYFKMTFIYNLKYFLK